MELVVALLLAGGIGSVVSIPYLKYKRYLNKIEAIAVSNNLEIKEYSLDEIFKLCSISFDTHQWRFRYEISQATLLASGYGNTKNMITSRANVVLLEDILLVVPFEEYEAFCKWHKEWVKDGLLATWHKKYKLESE